MNNRTQTISGITWLFASSALTKVITLAGQIVLGWLLQPEDFGVYAMAISVSTVVAALRNGGTHQVLIRTGSNYESQEGLFFKFSLAFNTIAMFVLLALALPYFHDNTAVGIVLVAIAISIPLGTLAMILKAKLTIDHRFPEIAKLGLWSAIVWQGGIVTGALFGLGALSYVWPLIIQMIYENFAAWFYEKRLPRLRQKTSWKSYVEIFRQTRWLMLSTAVLSLATTGIYFVIAWLTDARTVGIYFFAYQLVFAFSVPLSSTIYAALPTSLIQLESDRKRQVEAYLRAMRAILILGVPITAVFGLALPAFVHVVWQSKWDMAADISQILAACIPAWLVVAVVTALLEARGMWRLRFLTQCLYGIGGLASTAIGALLGGLESVAFCVVAFYNCLALLLLIGISKILGISVRQTIGCTVVPPMLGIATLLLSTELAPLISISEAPLAKQWILLAVFILLGSMGNLLLFREVWSQLLANMLGRLSRFLPALRGAPN